MARPKFNSKYGTKNDVVSNVGSRTKINYQLVIDDDGLEVLKPCGMTDLHSEIQSHAASVDINVILDRYKNGAVDVLEKANGFYADVSEMPVKLQDVMNLNLKGKSLFESLPLEQRKLYGNNYINFINNPRILVDYLNDKENVGSDVVTDKVNDDSEVENG